MGSVAFDSIDWAVYQAREHGLRIMAPLTDNYDYYHGVRVLLPCGFTGHHGVADAEI